MMKVFKRIICALSLLLIFAVLLASCSKTQRNIDNYEEDLKDYSITHNPTFLPSLDSLSKYKTIDYTKKTTEDILYTAHGYGLFLTYEQKDYETETERVNNTHSYLNNNNVRLYSKLLLADINYKGYDIKIVPLASGLDSCKHFGMIGFNDEKCAICYLLFSDQDLDYLDFAEDPSSGYADFIDEYFDFIG